MSHLDHLYRERFEALCIYEDSFERAFGRRPEPEELEELAEEVISVLPA